jgi:hypothetical protein
MDKMREAESRERIVLAVLNHRVHRKGTGGDDFKKIIDDVIEGSEKLTKWAHNGNSEGVNATE